MSETIQTKRCSKCKQFKSPSEFQKDRSRKDGLQCYCRQCKNQHRKLYRQENRVKFQQYEKQYYRQYHKTLKGYMRQVWTDMLKRCNDPKHKSFKYYGGRGIQIKFASFEEFFDYVTKELRAEPRGLTIDRINSDSHYERGNIRFVSLQENLKNRQF